MNLLKLGKYLGERRHQLGLRALEVAKKARVSRAYLSIIETGRNPRTGRPSKPSLEVLVLLSKILDLDLSDLVKLAGYNPEVIDILKPKSPNVGEDSNKDRHLAAKIRDLYHEVQMLPPPLFERLGEEVPSGIQRFKAHTNDHILVLSESAPERDSRITLDFIAAGLKHREACLLRLPPSETIENARRALSKRTGNKNLEGLTVVPWQETIAPYRQTRRFTRQVCLTADTKDLEGMGGTTNSTIRFATPDASRYLAWVRNPKEVLESEDYWPSDLHRLRPDVDFLLLCLYRMDDLRRIEKHDLSVTSMLLSLLESHDRVVLLTKEGKLLSDGEAVRNILGRIDLQGTDPNIWDRIRRIGDAHGIWRQPD